jgi:hypothetical protein
MVRPPLLNIAMEFTQPNQMLRQPRLRADGTHSKRNQSRIGDEMIMG